MIAIQGNNVRIDKTCPNQHVINDRKLTDFCHFVDKLLSIRTFSVNILSLWTIFYQYFVIYHVLIQTCLCQFGHCFLVVLCMLIGSRVHMVMGSLHHLVSGLRRCKDDDDAVRRVYDGSCGDGVGGIIW